MVRAPLYSAEIDAFRRDQPDLKSTSRVFALSIPNLITLGRILLVPVVVWAMTAQAMSPTRGCIEPPAR